MYGTTEFQIPAKAYGKMIQSAFQLTDRHHVDQRLGWVVMSAVTGIDDGNLCIHGSTERCTLLWVTHGNDISIAADNACSICDGFSLCGAGLVSTGKSESLSAKAEHGGFKGKAGPGAWLIKKSSKFFSVSHMGIDGRICFDPVGKIQNPQCFFFGKIKRIDQMSHTHSPFTIYCSRLAPTETNCIS